MTFKKKELRAAADRIAQATDAVLVEFGHAAEKRQAARTKKSVLRKAGKAALVAGATAATVFATRAAVRRMNHRGKKHR